MTTRNLEVGTSDRKTSESLLDLELVPYSPDIFVQTTFKRLGLYSKVVA